MLGKVECRHCQISSRERGGFPSRTRRRADLKRQEVINYPVCSQNISFFEFLITLQLFPYYPILLLLNSAQGHRLTVFNSSPILSYLPPVMFLLQTTLLQSLSSRLPMVSILLKSAVAVPRLILLSGSAASDTSDH